MDSKEKLAQALKDAIAPDFMIERATAGYYSDYGSDLETPCVQLVIDCQRLGLNDIAERAKSGEFDATKEESDEWFNREGKNIIKEMGLNPETFGKE